MQNAPDKWAYQTEEDPLEKTKEKYFSAEALVVDAGADHCSKAARERDEVQDSTDESWLVIKRYYSVSIALWTPWTTTV